MLLLVLFKIDVLLYYNYYVSKMDAFRCSSIDYTIFTNKSFTGKTWQEKLDNCYKCNCCARHNINKPRVLFPNVQEKDCIDDLDTSTEVWSLGLCRCKCRYLAKRMCEEANLELMWAPKPNQLPMPPQRWLSKDPSLVLLDAATEEALEHYWAGQVKACQYAIFHIC